MEIPLEYKNKKHNNEQRVEANKKKLTGVIIRYATACTTFDV